MTKEQRQERDLEIIELIKTKSQKEIGQMFGITQGRVGVILKKNGIKLSKGRLNMSKLGLDVQYFNNIDTKEKAYWLGFICADGYISRNGGKLSIIVKDKEICEKLKRDIKSEHKISFRENHDKRTNKVYSEYFYQITNAVFVSHIIDKGVTNTKNKHLEFPPMDEALYSYFIAGMFDGDGSICIRSSGGISCSLISSKEVLDFIQEYFFNKFGIKPKPLIQVSANCENIFRIHWQSISDCKTVLDYIYQGDNIYLSRKYEKYKQYFGEQR